MCGKLPGGSAGSVPSGRFSAASGTGVPHHGGAMSARAVVAPARGTANVTTSTASKRRPDITTPPDRKCAGSLPPCRRAKTLALHLRRQVGGAAGLDDPLQEARRALVPRSVEDQVRRPLLEDHALRHEADPVGDLARE